MEKSKDDKEETKLNALANGSEFLNEENPLPQEIFNMIFDDLSPNDLKHLLLTTKFLKCSVFFYHHNIIDRLVNDLTKLPFTFSFKENIRERSRTIGINPSLVNYLSDMLVKR